MNVFLTGCTGFIGDALSRELIKRGHDVSALARYVSTRDNHNLEEMFPGIRFHFGDLRDVESLKLAFRKTEPEIIVNLAAQSPVEYSFSHMREIYEVNYLGLVNLTIAAKECVPKLKKFIQASTAEVYGNQEMLPLTEDMRLRPASPYGEAKVASEYHLHYLKEGFDFPSIIARSANTYGRKRNKSFVVEHIVQELLQKKPEVRMGIPDSQRDFLYISDEVDFYVKLVETETDVTGETINSGTQEPISIRHLFKKIEGIVGFEPEKVVWNVHSPRPFEIHILTMDIGKARRLLGWAPKVSLDDGLEMTVEYWQDHKSTS